mmetsp:Transcript_14873/g.25334  ORF Transcript_14873/g.25334 Transcript_14873/m.25334 type:complete len:109 (+) Transcript_14873:368-694(+)
MKNQELTKNLFAFFIVNDFEEKRLGLKSELTLGYFDDSKFKGDLKWHPIVHKYMFAIQLDDIKVNGKSLNLGCGTSHNCTATIDSGTSHLAMPKWAIQQVQGRIPLRD